MTFGGKMAMPFGKGNPFSKKSRKGKMDSTEELQEALLSRRVAKKGGMRFGKKASKAC